MIRIVLIGGSSLLRGGLKLALEEPGTEVARSCASAEELNLDDEDGAPVIYLLLHAPGCAGIRQEIADLRRRNSRSRVAVMLTHLVANDLMEVFAAGGDGLLLEEIAPEALQESLKLIALGEKVFPSQLASLLSDSRRGAERMLPNSPLTGREMEIVRHLAFGKSNKAIANELNIALATVKVHVKSLLRKLGLSNRTQAAIWALDAGLVDPPKVAMKAKGDLRQCPAASETAALADSGLARIAQAEDDVLPSRACSLTALPQPSASATLQGTRSTRPSTPTRRGQVQPLLFPVNAAKRD